MTLQQMRKEIQTIKMALIERNEPGIKVFIQRLGESCISDSVDAYKAAHPHTSIVLLTRASCRCGT
jgi:hypothetical protein